MKITDPIWALLQAADGVISPESYQNIRIALEELEAALAPELGKLAEATLARRAAKQVAYRRGYYQRRQAEWRSAERLAGLGDSKGG